MADSTSTERPDFRQGVPIDALDENGMIVGRVDEDEVLLVRSGEELLAISPLCTHYSGALADGLVVGDTVRCPLHHACFSLRTGEAMRAPAFAPLSCWRVERQGDRVFVRGKVSPPHGPPRAPAPAR